MAVYECLRCGYNWDGRKKNPTACPRCKSYRWNFPQGITEKEKRVTEVTEPIKEVQSENTDGSKIGA